MIRRLLRFTVAAFYVLSLLAAAGLACLWWECRSGQGYVADTSVLGTYVLVELLPGTKGGVMVVRRWPGPATFRLWSQHAFYNEHPIYWAGSRLAPWHRLRFSGQSGQLAVYFRTDTGEPVRWNPGAMPPNSIVVRHGPMPAWTAGGIPPSLVIARLLVPPLFFESRRSRRVRELGAFGWGCASPAGTTCARCLARAPRCSLRCKGGFSVFSRHVVHAGLRVGGAG
jgi:hypothetical protein